MNPGSVNDDRAPIAALFTLARHAPSSAAGRRPGKRCGSHEIGAFATQKRPQPCL